LESARQDDDAEEARSRKVTAAALEGLPEGETVTSLMERVARLSADVESERRKQSALAAAQGEASAGESMLRAELDLAEKVPIFITDRFDPSYNPNRRTSPVTPSHPPPHLLTVVSRQRESARLSS